MKILFIVNNFPLLSETFILDQITGLVARGCQVDVLARFKGDNIKMHGDVVKYGLLNRTIYYDEINRRIPKNKIERIIKGIKILAEHSRNRNIKTIVKSVNIFMGGRHSLSLKPLYRASMFSGRGPYDIIHCHFGPNGKLGLYLRDIGALKGKIITTFHGYDLGQYTGTHGISTYKDLFRRCDLVTANSDFTKNKLKLLGCDEEKIKKIPMGLNIKKFQFQEKRIKQGENIKILTVARLVEKKGIEFAIEALAEVVKKIKTIKYYIAGDGPLLKHLKTKAVNLGIDDHIEFLGWQTRNEIIEYFSRCHIFILTSITSPKGDHEGQGLVLQEAQASGLPVICTRHNGFPESILDGKSGFLVPEKDSHSIAQTLIWLIDRKEEWAEIGNAGRTYVNEKYDIDKLNDRLMDTYRTVLNDPVVKKSNSHKQTIG